MNEQGKKYIAILMKRGFTLDEVKEIPPEKPVWSIATLTLTRGPIKHVAEVSDEGSGPLVYYNVYKPGAGDASDKPGVQGKWVDVVKDEEAVRSGEAMDVELYTEEELQDYLEGMFGKLEEEKPTYHS